MGYGDWEYVLLAAFCLALVPVLDYIADNSRLKLIALLLGSLVLAGILGVFGEDHKGAYWSPIFFFIVLGILYALIVWIPEKLKKYKSPDKQDK